jgi:ADP-ribose pyrophosphatase YjhB (NUDIX family)
VGDYQSRHVCVACGHVQYQNPRLIAGVIAESADGRILLCRRGIAPRVGRWTFPAGFLENGESGADGARREAFEEAGARVRSLELYTVIEVRTAHEVHLVHRGRLETSNVDAGPECSEVSLFDERNVPWSALAYPAIESCLRQYFADRRDGRFPVRAFDVIGESAEEGEVPSPTRVRPTHPLPLASS